MVEPTSPRRVRLAMVTTHPIQYQVPWLRLLAAHPAVDLTVYFAMLPDAREQGSEFGVSFAWDLPLLGGYTHRMLPNVAARPSLTEYSGCDTPSIVGELRRERFDAVIVNGWVAKTCLQALLGCRLSGTPCIVRGEANGLRARAGWKLAIHRLLLAQYSAVCSIGQRNREYCLARGVPASRIFATPYCVDNERFAASAAGWLERESRAGLRQRFGLHPQRTTFLFSGKYVKKKRPADLVEALRVALAQGADLQVLIVGSGPLEPLLRERARGLPVAFAGFLNQTEIAAAYAASDCLVLPSDAGETWGLVVNEAMACGLPALVSDEVGCAPDLVESGVTGRVFRCGDVQDLAEAMREMQAAARCEELGNAARARVESGYHFRRVVEGVLAAVDSVRARR